MEFCQFRRLRDLGGRKRFQPALEVGVGEVVEGGRVQGVEGERTGMRFKSDLERAAGEAVDGLDVKDPDDSGVVFEGSRGAFVALECAISLLQLIDHLYC